MQQTSTKSGNEIYYDAYKKIKQTFLFTLGDAVDNPPTGNLKNLTFCVHVLDDGSVSIGNHFPEDEESYLPNISEGFARHVALNAIIEKVAEFHGKD